MLNSVRHLVAFLALAWTGTLAAQPVVTQSLKAKAAETEEPFSRVGEVRELHDGRLIVLDTKDNQLHLVSADLGTVTSIGREGSGPTEYRRVTQLIRGAGDTTFAYDVMNARFLIIDHRGVAATTLSLREAARGLPVGPMVVRGYDATGRLYFQGMKFGMGATGPSISDTSYILRLDPERKRVDTLTTARIGSPGMRMSGDVQKGSGKVALSVPAFPVVDEWGLLPDGRVLVVRGATYRLDFVREVSDVVSRGPIRYERVKVTAKDKVKHREAQVAMQKEMSRAVAGAASSLTPAQRAQMPGMSIVDPSSWPEYKPAFGQGALRIAPDGEIWIGRLREAGNERPLYDVFAPDGALRYRVEFPRKTQLVGFGSKWLYAVREDSDELHYLGRYPRPAR